MNKIYAPMTCNVLIPGHIKFIKKLRKKGLVTVGLLSSKALNGYKKELIPFKSRKYILENIAKSIGGVRVVKQDSLNPEKNLKKYKASHLACDSFEKIELEAVKKLGIKTLKINSGDKLHSSDIQKTK